MKITMVEGQATIDAADLGPLLGLAPAEVPEKMRSDEITSRFETGIDEDAGRIRLTFYYNEEQIRLTCATDGSVLSTSRVPVSKKQ